MASDFDYPLSDHFDGERFFNPGNVGQKVQRLRSRSSRTQQKALARLAGKTRRRLPRNRETMKIHIQLTYVNHATVLIQFQGRNILTDPIWSERCSPVSFAGPKRHRAPGVAFDRLPVIHAVLISHNHYDHLDLPTLRRLHQRDRPLIIAGIGTRPFLEAEGFDRVVELTGGKSTNQNRVSRFILCPRNIGPKETFSGKTKCSGAGSSLKVLGAASFLPETPVTANTLAKLTPAWVPSMRRFCPSVPTNRFGLWRIFTWGPRTLCKPSMI